MSKIILFGGGDGGGLRITPEGIEPIPPFDPALRYQLRALNQLLKAGQLMPKKVSKKLLGSTITKLTGSVLSQLEANVGNIDADNGLIYQSDDGGFTCGSTGKPIMPFPWPVDPSLTVKQLLTEKILNAPTLSFLEQAARHKIDVFEVVRDPDEVADKIDVSLTQEIRETLKALKLDETREQDDIDREVIEFYRKVVIDGRFIPEWVTNPKEVAERLTLTVSSEAIERIVKTRDAGIIGRVGPEGVMSPYAVAVVIAIVIVVWDHEVNLPVIDSSGIKKL